MEQDEKLFWPCSKYVGESISKSKNVKEMTISRSISFSISPFLFFTISLQHILFDYNFFSFIFFFRYKCSMKEVRLWVNRFLETVLVITNALPRPRRFVVAYCVTCIQGGLYKALQRTITSSAFKFCFFVCVYVKRWYSYDKRTINYFSFF